MLQVASHLRLFNLGDQYDVTHAIDFLFAFLSIDLIVSFFYLSMLWKYVLKFHMFLIFHYAAVPEHCYVGVILYLHANSR